MLAPRAHETEKIIKILNAHELIRIARDVIGVGNSDTDWKIVPKSKTLVMIWWPDFRCSPTFAITPTSGRKAYRSSIRA